MRLICPNCGAQYEVPTEVIPTEGRDVQCSACSNTWFQARPDHDAGLADEVDRASVEPVALPPEPEPAPEPVQDAPTMMWQELDHEISDILRQEAEFEAAARAAEQGAPLETQPDLGLEAKPKNERECRAREARKRMARMRGEPEPDEVAVAAVTAAAGSRRDLLPNIEEINSTLRSSGERRRLAEADDAGLPGTTTRIERKGRRFRRGFVTMIMLGAAAVGAYIFGPQITEFVPASEPYMAQYSTLVEDARTWLGESVDGGLAWLDQKAAETTKP
ncbi:zinc-ribbon domain-containing protein [Planktotalea sp.]|uniref:zinc-ribbon domain-containing protein n=1 Tax=Planktotalea sp. TaxID=2029877 RepID=UPI0025CEC5C5|nr:zinc-ribbon domain-containing protein [Planktotalea sp.]